MQLDDKGLQFLANEEGGFILHPYKDSRGIPTISAGVTYYENGVSVKMADPNIELNRAKQLFHNIVSLFERDINTYVTKPITQNQFNALVSICYNIGQGGFNHSTLLQEVDKNPNDPNITKAFEMWKKAGNDLYALLPRRKREAQLYFS